MKKENSINKFRIRFRMFARLDLTVTTLRLRMSQSRMLVSGGVCRAAGWAAAADDWSWLLSSGRGHGRICNTMFLKGSFMNGLLCILHSSFWPTYFPLAITLLLLVNLGLIVQKTFFQKSAGSFRYYVQMCKGYGRKYKTWLLSFT